MEISNVRFTHERVEVAFGKEYHVLSPQCNLRIWFDHAGDYKSFELNSCDINSVADIEGLFIHQEGNFYPLTRVLEDAKLIIDECISDYRSEQEEEMAMSKYLSSPSETGRV